MKNMKNKDIRIDKSCTLSVIPLLFTILCGLILSSSVASADDSAVDDINITVPVSCTLSGVGTDSHNATLNNGTYSSNVGTTTLRAFCNDKDGFGIYAIGYTDDTDGKNVLASATLGSDFDIATGTATSGNSQWAMKLATDSNATYPIELQNGFGAFHAVPDDYTLVAKRDAGTDVGASASGSTLTTTYQIYVSSTQPTDYYSGQVKYVMVHPNDADAPVRFDQVAIVFDGNGLTFQGGDTKNRVAYSNACTMESGYIGNTPREIMTSNLSTDGVQNDDPYTDSESILELIPLAGADRIKVEVDYGITGGTTYMTIAKGDWGGWNEEDPMDIYYDIYSDENISGHKTFIFDGDTITIDSSSWGTPESGFDYGFYVRVYPIYNTEHQGSTYGGYEDCSLKAVSGTYKETTTWNGYWYTEWGGVFTNEGEIKNWVQEGLNYSEGGVTIYLYSANSYTIRFNANGGSGMMADQVVYPYEGSRLNTNSFVLSGKYFDGWNTKADGTGVSYSDEDEIWDPIDGARVGENVMLYAQWASYISYDDNGANSVTTMGDQIISGNASYVQLWPPNFQRSGYGLAGWNTKAYATGKIYGPSEVIDDELTLNSIKSDGLELYAIWIASAGDLQGWTGCGDLSVGAVTALTDSRDNDTYAVAKLSDGKCWMIENLRLDYDALHNSDGQLAQGYGGVFAGLAQPETAIFSNSTVANSLYYVGTQSGTASIDIGNNDDPGYRIPRYSNDNTGNTVNVMTNTSQNVYSYGNSYNWPAAVANTNKTTTSSWSSSTSICPAGWRIPRGGDKSNISINQNDFWILVISANNGVVPANYNDTYQPSYEDPEEAGLVNRLIRKYPNNFVGSHYISSTTFDNRRNYIISFSDYSVYPGTIITNKYSSLFIRCLIGN